MNLTTMRQMPGWSDLGEGELRSLGNYGVERWFRAGAPLQEQGTAIPGVALITQGDLQTLMLVKDLALKVELLGPGRWLGTEAMTEATTSYLSARAMSDVRVVVIGMDQIERLRATPTPLSLRIFRSLLLSTAQTEARMGALSAQVVELQAATAKPSRHDLLSFGFAKLSIGVQSAAAPLDRNGVELVQHDGVAIAANFRPLR